MNIYRKAALLSLSAIMLISFAFSAFADGTDTHYETYQAYSRQTEEFLTEYRRSRL